MKTVFVVAFAASWVVYAAPVVYGQGLPIPHLSFETTDEWNCQIYSAKPESFAPGVLAVRVFQTCTVPMLTSGLEQEHLSALNDYRIDCRTKTYAYVGSQTFDDQFWRRQNKYSKANEPLVFTAIETSLKSLFASVCSRTKK